MDDLKFDCPHCKQPLSAPPDLLGQTMTCPACSRPIRVPGAAPEAAPAAAPTPAPAPAPEPQEERKPCPYCGEQILAQARKCKHCGEFLDEELRRQQQQLQPPAPAPAAAPLKADAPIVEKTEYESHPAMFKSNPVGFVLSILLCVVGIGLIVLLFWWLNCLGTTLTVTNKRSVLRVGLLSKSISEVRHRDVRSIQVSQTFLQRVFDAGSIAVSSAGQSGIEILARGMPDPYKAKRIIDQYRM